MGKTKSLLLNLLKLIQKRMFKCFQGVLTVDMTVLLSVFRKKQCLFFSLVSNQLKQDNVRKLEAIVKLKIDGRSFLKSFSRVSLWSVS